MFCESQQGVKTEKLMPRLMHFIHSWYINPGHLCSRQHAQD